MPGTPDPVLGSDLLSLTVAAVLAGLAVLGPTLLPSALRTSLPRPVTLAVVGGLAYAVVCLGAWAGARLVADAFVSEMVSDPATFAGWALAGLVVLTVQA